jgi:hypothetical protein
MDRTAVGPQSHGKNSQSNIGLAENEFGKMLLRGIKVL